MAVDERRRVELFDRLSTAIGQEAAGTLMAMLPPGGEQVATKADVAVVKSDLAVVTSDLAVVKSDLGVVKSDIAGLRSEMEHRFAVVDEKFVSLEHRLTAAFEKSIREAITAQTRTLVFSQLGSLVVIAALAFGLR